MRNQIKANAHKGIGFLIFFLLLGTNAMAQVDPNCQTEWCDAKWPPAEGSDRTYGKDNCGNVCIKIQKVVEVEKIVEVNKPTKKTKQDKSSVTVTLSQNENN